ncbi:fibronectin type III domain-containing protein [Cellulosimicrobium sp. Marseille-Q8652]
MTQVRIALSRPIDGGTEPVKRGKLTWTPTRRRDADPDVVVLPLSFDVQIVDGEAVATVDPTGPGWCWRVFENTEGGEQRHVLVPDSEEPVRYRDLVDVDPKTLDPAAEPEAAWAVELGALRSIVETLPIADAVAAYLTENPPPAGLTEQQVHDLIAAALEALPPSQGQPGASAYQVAVANGFVGTATEWLASLKGAKGDAGPGTEWRTSATHLQARPVGAATWTDVVALAAISGDDGRELEVRNNGTAIQSRHEGDATWTDLVQLEDLRGPKGDRGDDAPGGGTGGERAEAVVFGDSLVSTDQHYDETELFHETLSTELGVPVSGQGYGGADTLAIGGMAGALRVDVTFAGPIPTTGSVQTVALEPDPRALQAEYEMHSGTVPGVDDAGQPVEAHGHWSGNTDPQSPKTFHRTTPGPAVTVLPGTPFRSDRAQGHRGKLAIMVSGGNDAGHGVTEAERIDAFLAVDRHYAGRFIAITSYDPANPARYAGTEQALRAALGGRHIALSTFLRTDALTWSGVAPTTEDTAALAAGNIPPSLLFSDGMHMNGNAHRALARKVRAVVRALDLMPVGDGTTPPVDTTPPAAPTGLDNTASTSTTITLVWTAPEPGAQYRTRTNGGTPSGWFTGTTRTVTGLTPSTSYTFEVQARDAAGNASLLWSDPHTAATTAPPSDTTRPSTPVVGAPINVTTTSARVPWSAATDDQGVDHYRVGGEVPEQEVTTLYADLTGLTPDRDYEVLVWAVDAAGNESLTPGSTTVSTLAETPEPGAFPIDGVALVYDAAVSTVHPDVPTKRGAFQNQGTETGVDLIRWLAANQGASVVTSGGQSWATGDTVFATQTAYDVRANRDLRSLAMVVKVGDLSTFRKIAQIRPAGTDPQWDGYLGADTTKTSARGTAGGEAVNGMVLAPATPAVLVMTYAGGSGAVSLWVNGVAHATSDTSWTDVTVMKYLTVYAAGETLSWSKIYADDRAWTTQEVADVTAFLKAAYGIA